MREKPEKDGVAAFMPIEATAAAYDAA